MKIKADHSWAENGDVIVVLRDHDAAAIQTQYRYNQDRSALAPYDYQTRRVRELERYRYPRGLAGKELRDLKRALVRAITLREETKANEL